jgi:hypothetical protein
MARQAPSSDRNYRLAAIRSLINRWSYESIVSIPMVAWSYSRDRRGLLAGNPLLASNAHELPATKDFSCSHAVNLRFFRSMGGFAFGGFPGITADFLADDSFGSLIQVLTKRLTKFHVLRP